MIQTIEPEQRKQRAELIQTRLEEIWTRNAFMEFSIPRNEFIIVGSFFLKKKKKIPSHF